MQGYIQKNIPGAVVTSGLRNPEHNADVGGVPDSQHLTGQAVDFVMPHGTTFEQVKHAVAQSGLQPTEFINEGNHVHLAWGPKTGAAAPAAKPLDFSDQAAPLDFSAHATAPAQTKSLWEHVQDLMGGTQLPNPKAPQDTWLQEGEKFLQNIPAMAKQTVGGLTQALGEMKPEPNIAAGMSQQDLATLQPNVDAAAAAAPNTPGTMANTGRQMAATAAQQLKANAPNVPGASFQGFANTAGQGMVQMAPGLALSAITKSPTPFMAEAATAAYGDAYAQARARGLAPEQAQTEAATDAAATALGFKLFEVMPFKHELGTVTNEATGAIANVYKTTIGDMIKNLSLQGLGIQPAISVADKVVDNVTEGKHPTDGLPGPLLQEGVVNTIMAGVGHLASGTGPRLGEWQQMAPGETRAYDPSAHHQGPIIDQEGPGAAPTGAPSLSGPPKTPGGAPVADSDIGLKFPDGSVQRATVQGYSPDGKVVRVQFEDGSVADHVTDEVMRDLAPPPPPRYSREEPPPKGYERQLGPDEGKPPPFGEAATEPPGASAAAKIAARQPQPQLDPQAIHALDLADRLEGAAMDRGVPMTTQDRINALQQAGRLRAQFTTAGEESQPGGYRHPLAGEPAADLGELAGARAANPALYEQPNGGTNVSQKSEVGENGAERPGEVQPVSVSSAPDARLLPGLPQRLQEELAQNPSPERRAEIESQLQASRHGIPGGGDAGVGTVPGVRDGTEPNALPGLQRPGSNPVAVRGMPEAPAQGEDQGANANGQPPDRGNDSVAVADHDSAAAVTDINPSPAQISAGNYRKGKINIQGIPVSIETAKGQVRGGVGADGQPWENQNDLAHYGYITAQGQMGTDGDHVDAYVGPHPSSPVAYVVDQVDPQTGMFDESKAILGANTEKEARAIYDAGFSDGSGPKRLGAITKMPMVPFKDWLKNGDMHAPLSPEADPDYSAALWDVRDARSTAKTDKDVLGTIIAMGGVKIDNARGETTPEGQTIREIARDYRRPGLINNRSGVKPDYLREALRERGWFGYREDQGTDMQDLYDLLDRGVRGEKVYHPESDAPAIAARRALVDEELGRAGVTSKDSHADAAKKLLAFRHEGLEAMAAESQRGADAEVEQMSPGARELLSEYGYEPGADYGAEFEAGAEEPRGAPEAQQPEEPKSQGPPARHEGAGEPEEGGRALAPEAEAVDLGGGKTAHQQVIPGAEQSARQLAKSREVAGHGRIKPRAEQKPPVGLFDEPSQQKPFQFEQPGHVGAQGNTEDISDSLDRWFTERNIGTAPADISRGIRDYLLARGHDTGMEALALYSAAENNVPHAVTENSPSSVAFTPAIITEIADPARSIIAHHNHPSAYSLSGADLDALSYPGLRWVIAHAGDGDWYAASLTPSTRALLERLGPDGLLARLRTAHDEITKRLETRFIRAIRAGTMSMQDAASEFHHSVNSILAHNGLINYVTSKESSRHAAEAAADIARSFPTQTAYRHAEPVQYESGIGKILAEHEGASRQPGGEKGDHDGNRLPQPPENPGDRPKGLEQPQTKDLIVQHNLSAENFLHADRMGALAAPSLAITKAEHPSTNFGEITLLGHKDLANPRMGAKVFGADIYSPRYPQISYKLGNPAIKKIAGILKPFHREEDGPLRLPYGGFDGDEMRSIPAFERYAQHVTGEKYPDYRPIAKKMLEDAGAEEKLFRGFNYNGNRTYKAHTLENVIKILKKEIRGGENFNYGVGSLRSKYTPQFRNVEQIRRAKDRLVSHDKFEEMKKDIDEKFWGLADRLRPYYEHDGNSFGFGDTVINALGDAAKDGLQRSLREYDFDNVPDDILADTRNYLESLRHLPTEYFEAKHLRGVGLPEFHTAVIPHDASPEVRDVLKRRGIETVEYKRGDVDDRRRAIAEAANASADKIMFQKGAAPLSEQRFYSQYAQHIDLRGREAGTALQNREAILRDGFKRGVSVNAVPPFRGGEAQSVADYKPQAGDVVYLAPRAAWKDTPNGMTIQPGWKPKPYEAVVITDPDKSMYQNYLDGFGGADVRAQAAKPFFSALTRAVETLPQQKAPAAQWSGIIDNLKQKGVKGDEIDWSGIKTWLADEKAIHGDQPVEKKRIVEFLRNNEVQIKEVLRGGIKRDDMIPDPKAQEDYKDRWDNLVRQITEKREQKSSGSGPVSPADLQREIDRLVDAQDELHDQMVDDTYNRARASGVTSGGTTKYSQYTLPGGENYRELLLTLPEKSGGERGPKGWGDTHGGTMDTANFRSAHWDEPNILAHVRFDDRTGPNGENILHVSEIQSDMHQAGRRRGYRDKDAEAVAKAASNERAAMLPAVNEMLKRHDYMGFDTRDEARSAVVAEPNSWDYDSPEDKKLAQDFSSIAKKNIEAKKALEEGVPDAPFKTTWQELAAKRMLRYAAENGYDKLSWDTGDTNADRYDLSHHIDHVDHRDNGDGTFNVEAGKGHEQVWHDDRATPQIISDHLGKDIADKISAGEGEKSPRRPLIDAGFKRLSGLDLKVGGSGMRGFYDKILPTFLNKYAKKWGAKVEDGQINNEKSGFMEKYYDGPELSADQVYYKMSGKSWQELPVSIQAQIRELHGLLAERSLQFGDAATQSLSARAAEYLGGEMKERETPKVGDRVHAIDITPAMRDSVMAGQPLFQPGRSTAYSDVAGTKRLAPDFYARLPRQPGPEEARMIEQVNRIIKQLAPDAKVITAKDLTYQGQPIYGATYSDGPRTLIAWALDSPHPEHTGAHEAIHYLRNVGFFKPGEWKRLSQAAIDGNWLGKHDVDTRWSDLDEASKIEESIAEEFADWNGRQTTPPPEVRSIFGRLRNLLARVGKFIRSLFGKNATAEEIFRKVASGEVGSREPIEGWKPSAEVSAQAAKTPEGAVESVPEGRDYIDETAKDLAEHLRGKGPGTIERTIQHLSPGGEELRRAGAVERHVMGPRTLAEMDTTSARLWNAMQAEDNEGSQRLAGLRDDIKDNFLKLPEVNQNRVNAVMELDRLDNRTRADDGRSIVAQNTDHEHAQGSKPGERIILSPEETKGYFGLQTMYRHAWDNIMEGTARRMGWMRPWSESMPENLKGIERAVETADHPRNRKAFKRVMDVMRAMDDQRRAAYMPLMRFGDYYFSVKGKERPGVDSTGGFPPTEWFSLVEPPAMRWADIAGETTKSGAIPAHAKKALTELQQRFDPKQYRIEHGYLMNKPEVFRSLSIPAVEKLLMLTQSGVMNRLLEETSMDGFANKGAARKAAKDKYDELYSDLVDAVQDEMYESLKAGFKKRARAIPGYSGDWNRVLGNYMGWTSRHVAKQIHSDEIERLHDDIQTSHPHAPTREFWRKWKADDETPMSPLGRAGIAANQVGFLYTLALNPASMFSIMMHGPTYAVPVLSTGIGATKAAPAFVKAYGTAVSAIRADTEQGLHINISKVGATPDERAFLAKLERDGDLHAKGADDIRSMAEKSSAIWGRYSPHAKQAMDIVSSNIAVADQANRVAAALTAYRLARDGNLGHMDATWKANQVWRTMSHRDGVSPETMAKFLLTQSVGEWSSAGRSEWGRSWFGRLTTSLHGFQIRMLANLMKQWGRQGGAGRMAGMLTLAGLWAAAGLQGLPFVQDAENAVDALWKWARGNDPMLEWRLRAMLADSGLGRWGADMMLRGPLSTLTGVDFASRLGFGDIISREMAEDTAMTAPSIAAGILVGTAKRLHSHQTAAAAATPLPAGLRHPIQAEIDAEHGVKSQTGRSTYVPARKFTPGDQIAESLGFMPLDVTRARERQEYHYRAQHAHGPVPPERLPR